MINMKKRIVLIIIALIVVLTILITNNYIKTIKIQNKLLGAKNISYGIIKDVEKYINEYEYKNLGEKIPNEIEFECNGENYSLTEESEKVFNSKILKKI